MSSQRDLITQEIRNREDLRVGTALTDPAIKAYDNSAGNSPTWVQDVDIGSNRPLQDLLVRASNGSRAYAARGSSVLLKRNTQGTWDVIGPGDRVTSTKVIAFYEYGVTTADSEENQGFSSRLEPFEFYQGTGAPNSLWNDGNTPFPKTTIIDGDGNALN